MSSRLRNRALGASALALLALSGCGGPKLDDAPPPPSMYQEPPPPPEPEWREPSSELLGGPPSREPESIAPEDYGFGTMAPIPNPEDLDEESRQLIYGGASAEPAGRPASARESEPALSYGRADTDVLVGGDRAENAAPLARTDTDAATARAANPRPAAQAGSQLSAPMRAAAPSPAPTAAAPANIDAVAEALGSALAAEVAAGAKIDVPAGVLQGQEGVVVLTLPKTLLARLQQEASRLGLTEAARQADVLAILAAEGYDIVPTAKQTVLLKADEAASLSWKVTPKAGDKGPFQAMVSGELKGAARPTPFWIAVVEHGAPAAAAAREPADQQRWLDLPGLPFVTVPGIGQVRSGTIVLFGIALVILILLAGAARKARERRLAKEREQRSRRLAEIAQSEPATAEQSSPTETSEPQSPPKKDQQDA